MGKKKYFQIGDFGPHGKNFRHDWFKGQKSVIQQLTCDSLVKYQQLYWWEVCFPASCVRAFYN